MTPKERLETVINGGIPDRTPATIHQWQTYHYRNIMGVESDLEAFRISGLDAVVYPGQFITGKESAEWKIENIETENDGDMTSLEVRLETPDGVLTGKARQNEYTTSTTEHLFKEPEDIRIIENYLPVPEFDVDGVKKMKDDLGEDGIMRTFTNGPQGSPWQDACVFYGTENMIYRAFDDPDWTHEFLEIILQKKMAYYRKNLIPLKGVFAMIETGGGAASNNVISPSMFEEFCLPYDKRQHDLIHEIDPDIAISYHTCGGMMKLLDLIPQNGCDFSETLSPPGSGGDIVNFQDEKTIKEGLGSKIKLMGGIDQSGVLEKGSREEIYTEVERCFKGYGEGGGYIMMPSDHFFHAPKENIESYAAAVAEICCY